LKLTLEAPATPEHVRAVADLFAETLKRIDPALGEAGVTMVVQNFATNAELRGRTEAGRQAVRLFGDLIQHPIEAVQRHPELTEAAYIVADRGEALVPHVPRFYRGSKEIGRVDDVFVRSVRAAGQSTIRFAEGDPSGETVTHSRILRIGRQDERRSLAIRIELWGRPKEIEVDPHISERMLWEMARDGVVARLRVRGSWVRSDKGLLELREPRLVDVEATFSPWSGSELLAEMKEHADAFSRADFGRMLRELQEQREDEP
jgi:hypothetical protein